MTCENAFKQSLTFLTANLPQEFASTIFPVYTECLSLSASPPHHLSLPLYLFFCVIFFHFLIVNRNLIFRSVHRNVFYFPFSTAIIFFYTSHSLSMFFFYSSPNFLSFHFLFFSILFLILFFIFFFHFFHRFTEELFLFYDNIQSI